MRYGTFSNIQRSAGKLRGIKAYLDIFRLYCGILILIRMGILGVCFALGEGEKLKTSLVTGPSFMSVSWPVLEFMSVSCPVLELQKFSLINDLSEIWKSDIPLSEFYPLSGDCGELEIPNLARISLIKCHCFYCFWVIKGKPTGGIPPSPSPRLGLSYIWQILNSV